WARDALKMTFQGLEYPPNTSSSVQRQSASQPPETPTSKFAGPRRESVIRELEDVEENAVVVAEGFLVKPMPASLELVKQRVDKDVAFHPKSGGFAFRLHAKIGESVIGPLIERLQRVEQLVDFVEVVKKHENTLYCETVSLGQVIFSYGNSEPSHSDAMVVDTQSSKHRATIDFSNA